MCPISCTTHFFPGAEGEKESSVVSIWEYCGPAHKPGLLDPEATRGTATIPSSPSSSSVT